MFEVDADACRGAAANAKDHRIRQILLDMAAELDRRAASDDATGSKPLINW
jgi:hypothetical protein